MLKKVMKSYDYSIVIVYILLCLFGLIMIYSSSTVSAIQRNGVESDYFYNKQKIHILISFLLFGAAAIFPYKAFRNKKFLVAMVILSVGGLLLVSLIGHNSNNAQSWLKLGSRSIQPSEFIKLSVILYLSAAYANKQAYIDQFNRGVAPPLIYLLFVCFLIVQEPDIGSAFIIFMIGITIILCSGMRMRTIMKLVSIAVLIVAMIAPFLILKSDSIFTETRMGRISGFLDPFGSAGKEGYHLVNSYLAIGSGGIKGLGLGQSIQKLGYLPESHTDFIMAIIAEELGIFGVAFVLFGLAFIVLKGIMVGIKSRDPFGSMLAIGISSMIGIQSFINLGGMSGLIPITGVTLPFISYGGSSLMVLSISMGILTNVAMFNRYDRIYRPGKQEPVPVQRNPQSLSSIQRNSIRH